MNNKRMLLLVLSLGLLLVLLAALPVAAQDSGKLTINTDFVRVRFGPDTGYKIIGYVHDGEQYTYKGIDASGTWINISYRGMQGWVNYNYVEDGVKLVRSLERDEIVPGRVTAHVLNVREDNSLTSDIVGKVKRGTMLNLLARDDSGLWLLAETRDGSISGWVSSAFVNVGAQEYFNRIPLLSRVPGIGLNVNPQ